MSLRCPNCFSGRVERLDNGRRIGGCLGSVVGAGATILKQAEAGVPVPELCREHGMSSASFYK